MGEATSSIGRAAGPNPNLRGFITELAKSQGKKIDAKLLNDVLGDGKVTKEEFNSLGFDSKVWEGIGTEADNNMQKMSRGYNNTSAEAITEAEAAKFFEVTDKYAQLKYHRLYANEATRGQALELAEKDYFEAQQFQAADLEGAINRAQNICTGLKNDSTAKELTLEQVLELKDQQQREIFATKYQLDLNKHIKEEFGEVIYKTKISQLPNNALALEDLCFYHEFLRLGEMTEQARQQASKATEARHTTAGPDQLSGAAGLDKQSNDLSPVLFYIGQDPVTQQMFNNLWNRIKTQKVSIAGIERKFGELDENVQKTEVVYNFINLKVLQTMANNLQQQISNDDIKKYLQEQGVLSPTDQEITQARNNQTAMGNIIKTKEQSGEINERDEIEKMRQLFSDFKFAETEEGKKLEREIGEKLRSRIASLLEGISPEGSVGSGTTQRQTTNQGQQSSAADTDPQRPAVRQNTQPSGTNNRAETDNTPLLFEIGDKKITQQMFDRTFQRMRTQEVNLPGGVKIAFDSLVPIAQKKQIVKIFIENKVLKQLFPKVVDDDIKKYLQELGVSNPTPQEITRVRSNELVMGNLVIEKSKRGEISDEEYRQLQQEVFEKFKFAATPGGQALEKEIGASLKEELSDTGRKESSSPIDAVLGESSDATGGGAIAKTPNPPAGQVSALGDSPTTDSKTAKIPSSGGTPASKDVRTTGSATAKQPSALPVPSLNTAGTTQGATAKSAVATKTEPPTEIGQGEITANIMNGQNVIIPKYAAVGILKEENEGTTKSYFVNYRGGQQDGKSIPPQSNVKVEAKKIRLTRPIRQPGVAAKQ